MFRNLLNKVSSVGSAIGAKVGKTVTKAFKGNSKPFRASALDAIQRDKPVGPQVNEKIAIQNSLQNYQHGPGASYTPTPTLVTQTKANLPGMNYTPYNPGQSAGSLYSPAREGVRPSTATATSSKRGGYVDSSRNVEVSYDSKGNAIEKGLQGAGGEGGFQTQSFNFSPSAPQQGLSGLSGGSAFTGLLSPGGGLGTPSVQRGTTSPFGEDALTDKKRGMGGILGNAFMSGLSALPGPLGTFANIAGAAAPFLGRASTPPVPVQSPLPPAEQRLSVDVGGATQDAGALYESQKNNKSTLSSTYATSMDDRAETTATFNYEAQRRKQELDAESLPIDNPVQDTEEQAAFLEQFEPQERRNYMQELDSFRASLGGDQTMSQRVEATKQLQAITDTYKKVTDDILKNPDMPKGLAARRIKAIAEDQKNVAMQVINTIEVLDFKLNQINQQVNERFNILKFEADEDARREQANINKLDKYISSGLIAGFSDSDIAKIAAATGYPPSALKKARDAALTPSPDTETRTAADGSIIQIVTDKKTGQASVNVLAPGKVNIPSTGKAVGVTGNSAVDQWANLLATGQANISNVPTNIRNSVVARVGELGTGINKPLSDGAITKISEVEAAIGELSGLKTKISANSDLLGPVTGLQRFNPFSKAKKLQADVDKVRQRVGKALEGGVLRKEDEAKYKNILATLSDTPSTAVYKIDGLISTLQNDIAAFKSTQSGAGRYVPGGSAASTPDSLRAKYNY